MDLMDAAKAGMLGRVTELLTEVNVNARDAIERTALHWACQEGHTECVRLLLASGADASVVDVSGRLALHVAASNGHTACVQLLLAARPSDVAAVGLYRRTALHLAAMYGMADCCRLLLDAGSEVDASDKGGNTPLYWALSNNYQHIVELLLDRGGKLSNVQLGEDIREVPAWALLIVERRNACRAACVGILGLLRRTHVIGGNGRDALRLVAVAVWRSRLSEEWNEAAAHKRFRMSK